MDKHIFTVNYFKKKMENNIWKKKKKKTMQVFSLKQAYTVI